MLSLAVPGRHTSLHGPKSIYTILREVSNPDTESDVVSVEEFILMTLCIHSELEFSVTSIQKELF